MTYSTSSYDFKPGQVRLIEDALAGNAEAVELLDELLASANERFSQERKAEEERKQYRIEAAEQREGRIAAILAAFDPYEPTGDWRQDRCSATAGGYSRADFGGHRCTKTPKWIGRRFADGMAGLGSTASHHNDRPYCTIHRNEIAGTRRSY